MSRRLTLEQARAAIAAAVEKEGQGCHVALVPPLKFAKQLTSYRLDKGWSRAHLAKAADCKVRDVAAWEDADAYPTEEQIGRLAWLLAGDEAGDVRDYWVYLVEDAQAFDREQVEWETAKTQKAGSDAPLEN